ncbi:hypothetical protein [Vibrio harveyi]|uniref:hypothetical protein n=1 Tax=Vibrio harveyi group TaxID=717610 RepID=UPI003AAF978F
MKNTAECSYNYSDVFSEESKKAKALRQDTYSKNLKAYYSQDSSDYKAVSRIAQKSKEEVDAKYAKYEQKFASSAN